MLDLKLLARLSGAFLPAPSLLRIAASLILLCGGGAMAAEKLDHVGDWLVSRTQDAFSDNGDKVLAVAPDTNQHYLVGVRCIDSKVSVILKQVNGDDPDIKDETFYEGKFRADKNEALDLFGIGESNNIVEFTRAEDMLRQIKDAKQFAFRYNIKGGTYLADVVFRPAGTSNAVQAIIQQCHVE